MMRDSDKDEFYSISDCDSDHEMEDKTAVRKNDEWSGFSIDSEDELDDAIKLFKNKSEADFQMKTSKEDRLRFLMREMNSRPCSDEMFNEAKQLVTDIVYPYYRKPMSYVAPQEFLCSICRYVLDDPVILQETGETFDRKCIHSWLKLGFSVCPGSKEHLWLESVLCSNVLVQSLISKWLDSRGLPPNSVPVVVVSTVECGDERRMFDDLKKSLFSSNLTVQKICLTELLEGVRRIPAFVELLGESVFTIFGLLILLIKASNRFDENMEVSILDILSFGSSVSDRLKLLLAENSFTKASLNLCQSRNSHYIETIRHNISRNSDFAEQNFDDQNTQEALFCQLLREVIEKVFEYLNAYVSEAYDISEVTVYKHLKEMTYCLILDSLMNCLEELDALWGFLKVRADSAEKEDNLEGDEKEGKLKSPEDMLELIVNKFFHEKSVEIANHILTRISCLDALVDATET